MLRICENGAAPGGFISMRNALQNVYSGLIVIGTSYLLIGPVFTGLMSILLSEELGYVEIVPLYDLEINAKNARFIVDHIDHTEASRLNRCFGLLSLLHNERV
jgi:hypothetical protein